VAYQFRYITFVLAVLLLAGFAHAIADPSMLYCQKLGYTTSVATTSAGDVGYCIVNGNKYDSWAFFNGLVGQKYSYCAKKGYDTQNGPVPGNAFGMTEAFCVPKSLSIKSSMTVSSLFAGSAPKKIAMVDLMASNGDSFIGTGISAMGAGRPSPRATAASVQSSGATIPSSFDWRNYNGKNWMTSVKDQAGCGSCWDFSAVGTVEAKFNIDNNNPDLNYDLSEQDMLTCSHAGSCGGGWPSDTLNYIKTTGVVDEKCDPYLARDTACSLCSDWQNRTFKIQNYYYVPGGADDYKRALMMYGPLSIGIDYREMFGPGAYLNLNHAVVLVGWNDAGRYWIIKNSWGTSFGDKGYAKIPYGGSLEANKYVYAVGQTVKPVIPPAPDPKPNPKPDPHDVPEYNLAGLALVLAAGIVMVAWRRR